jgi:hypothetical protein
MYKKLLAHFSGQDNENKKMIAELHKIPVRETRFQMPVFQDFKPDFTHQIDTLYLPNARGGYKFLLVCVDNYTRHFDAEPMKERKAVDALRAIKKIYTRQKMPKRIEVDAGKEFQAEFKEYFNDNGVDVRVAEVNRHRQEGLVEGRNGILGKAIFLLLDSKELKSGKTAKDWYKNGVEFRKLIDFINDEIKFEPLKEPEQENIRVDDSNRDIIPVGTHVRVALDYPISLATNKRLGSKFRTTDIRWSKDIKRIEWDVLQPNQPPMYKIAGLDALRTKQQLLLTKFV